MKTSEKRAIDKALGDVMINLQCAKNALSGTDVSRHNISLCIVFLQTGIEKLTKAQKNIWEK